ncbi:MAG: hypothetical protein JWO65_949, partial [Sphingomonas bacterium]|nr:hypothetical protein [Sphingomonas bacterium]
RPPPGVGPLTSLAFRDDGRSARALPTISRCRRPSRSHVSAVSIRRNRHSGTDQPMRRRTRSYRALRSGARAADALPQMVGAESLGHANRAASRHGESPRRRGAQAGCHPAPDVERRRRVPLGQSASARSSMRRHEPVSSEEAGSDRSHGDDRRDDLVESPDPQLRLKVAKQLEAFRSPDPIMRQPSADLGENRVIHGNDHEYEEAA